MRKEYLPRPSGIPGTNNPRRIYSTTPIEIDLDRSPDQFRCIQIPEPNLIFGDHGCCTDPRTGLMLFGPYRGSQEIEVAPIRVGIVGTFEGIQIAARLLQDLSGPIEQNESIDCVLHPSFPGISSQHPFRSNFVSGPEWLRPLDSEELHCVSGLENLSARMACLQEIFGKQVRAMSELKEPPHVVLCAVVEPISRLLEIDLASEITEHAFPVACSPDANKDRCYRAFQKFRAVLKAACIGLLPTEILGDAINSEPCIYADRATQAWDLSLALLYKAGVTPWRLENAAEASCFVGISRYGCSNGISPSVVGSFAHVLTERGERFVVPGVPFGDSSEQVADVTLTSNEERSRRLLTRALAVFEAHNGFPPRKVTVHKATPYSEAERSGFAQVLSNVPNYGLMTVSPSGISCIRPGRNPILRGTTIPFDEKTGLIATSGYVPFLRASVGNASTQLLAISENWGTISFQQAAEDVFRLTKLNLSSADFCSELPLTLSQNSAIGNVLHVLGPKRVPIRDTYYV